MPHTKHLSPSNSLSIITHNLKFIQHTPSAQGTSILKLIWWGSLLMGVKCVFQHENFQISQFSCFLISTTCVLWYILVFRQMNGHNTYYQSPRNPQKICMPAKNFLEKLIIFLSTRVSRNLRNPRSVPSQYRMSILSTKIENWMKTSRCFAK